jgi:hypothetical protein
MIAKEMFKELGYVLDEEKSVRSDLNSNDFIKYVNKNHEHYCTAEVWFDLEQETYSHQDDDVYECRPMDIDVDLHKAIIQQIKELGWL